MSQSFQSINFEGNLKNEYSVLQQFVIGTALLCFYTEKKLFESAMLPFPVRFS